MDGEFINNKPNGALASVPAPNHAAPDAELAAAPMGRGTRTAQVDLQGLRGKTLKEAEQATAEFIESFDKAATSSARDLEGAHACVVGVA